MDKRVQAVIIMLMMLSLSFFIYIFMIPAQHIRSEYNNYGTNITDVQQEVVAEREHGGLVGSLLISAATVVGMVFVYRVHMAKKKAQESSSVPETEDSTEHHE